MNSICSSVYIADVCDRDKIRCGANRAASSGGTERPKSSATDWALTGALAVVIALIAYEQIGDTRYAGQAQQASVAPTASAPQSQGISVAVLPFANMSGDAGQEFFSDGMTEEITSALARVQGLTVIGRTSAFEYKGQNRDLRVIGQALGVTHLIEGSVRKDGNRVRITAQLIRADNAAHLWTNNYDRQLTDIFAVQEDIAQAIAGALKVPLGLAQGDSLVRDRTKDVEGYDEYLRARALYRSRGFGNTEAIAALEKIVARDPEFAPAWATLSNAYRRSASFQIPALRTGPVEDARRVVQAAQAKAEGAARRAIQLDPKSAAGYGALAAIQTENGKWMEAEDLFRQALALDANEPDTLGSYGSMLATVGRIKGESSSIPEKLRMLEPLDLAHKVTTGFVTMMIGQPAAAIPVLEALPSDLAVRFELLAQSYAAVGRYADAANALLAIPANAHSRQSVEDATQLIRSAPVNMNAPQRLPALERGLDFVYAYVGAVDRVLDQPERRFAIRGGGFDVNLWFPEYAPLRRTERFKVFVRKAGLVDIWRARGWPDLCHPVGTDDFECD